MSTTISKPNVSLGDLLRRRRLEHDHTQTHVAEILGVNQSTVAKYERGDGIGPERLARIADYLDMEFSEVLSIYHGFADGAGRSVEPEEALESQVEELTRVVRDLSAQLELLSTLLAVDPKRAVKTST